MDAIRRHLLLSALFTGAALILLPYTVAKGEYLLAGAAAVATAIGLVFLVMEARKLESARLIMENQLLGTCTATVSSMQHKGSSHQREAECILSPFGLLVGGKVYKFGRDGIRLHSVDIGESRILVSFGTETRHWTADFLHGPLDDEALSALVEAIEHETGIHPGFHEAQDEHAEGA